MYTITAFVRIGFFCVSNKDRRAIERRTKFKRTRKTATMAMIIITDSPARYGILLRRVVTTITSSRYYRAGTLDLACTSRGIVPSSDCYRGRADSIGAVLAFRDSRSLSGRRGLPLREIPSSLVNRRKGAMLALRDPGQPAGVSGANYRDIYICIS